jgi:hypothetical protein
MIAIIAALAIALPNQASADRIIEASYFYGACSRWDTTLANENTVADIVAVDQRLLAVYERGKNENANLPLSWQQCETIMRDAKRAVEAAAHN